MNPIFVLKLHENLIASPTWHLMTFFCYKSKRERERERGGGEREEFIGRKKERENQWWNSERESECLYQKGFLSTQDRRTLI